MLCRILSICSLGKFTFLTLEKQLAFSFMKVLRAYLRKTEKVDEIKIKVDLRMLLVSGVGCGRGKF